MPDYDGAAVLEAIRLIQTSSTSDAVISELSRFIEGYGFERIFPRTIGQSRKCRFERHSVHFRLA